jgi:hypothetical protein
VLSRSPPSTFSSESPTIRRTWLPLAGVAAPVRFTVGGIGRNLSRRLSQAHLQPQNAGITRGLARIEARSVPFMPCAKIAPMRETDLPRRASFSGDFASKDVSVLLLHQRRCCPEDSSPYQSAPERGTTSLTGLSKRSEGHTHNDCKLVAPPKEGPGFHAIARSTQILARKEEPEGRTGRDGSRVETLGRLAPNETNLWLRSEKTREWTYAAFREIGRP